MQDSGATVHDLASVVEIKILASRLLKRLTPSIPAYQSLPSILILDRQHK
jgi:hypothetical protein